MAVAGDGAAADRALTQVKAVDDLYPLVGEMVLEPAMPLEQALGLENGLSGAVMERALSDRLGLSPGDTFKLGVKEFRLSALIVREPDSAASGFALGPRTLLRTEALDGAGLLAEGTLFNSKYRMLLPADTDLDQLLPIPTLINCALPPVRGSKTAGCAGPMRATEHRGCRALSNG